MTKDSKAETNTGDRTGPADTEGDPRDTDHPTGSQQAAENEAKDPPG